MLDKLTEAAFAAHLNQKFHIHYGESESLETELIEVSNMKSDSTAEDREPFSIILRSSMKDSYLLQNTYKVEHDEMGTLELFLVPLGADEHGFRYEAVFN